VAASLAKRARVRWIGHRPHAEVNIAVDPQLSVEAGHAIAKERCATTCWVI